MKYYFIWHSLIIFFVFESVKVEILFYTLLECGFYHTFNKTVLKHLKIVQTKQKKKIRVAGDEDAATEDATWINEDEVNENYTNTNMSVSCFNAYHKNVWDFKESLNFW